MNFISRCATHFSFVAFEWNSNYAPVRRTNEKSIFKLRRQRWKLAVENHSTFLTTTAFSPTHLDAILVFRQNSCKRRRSLGSFFVVVCQLQNENEYEYFHDVRSDNLSLRLLLGWIEMAAWAQFHHNIFASDIPYILIVTPAILQFQCIICLNGDWVI